MCTISCVVFSLYDCSCFCSCTRATLVAELVQRAEVMLQDKVKEKDANHDKLLEEVCAHLYEEGSQALIKGRE